MLTLVESQRPVVAGTTAKAAGVSGCVDAAGKVLTLATGDVLFREGEPRDQVFRVETGALCLFRTRPDGAQEILEFAFPGDLVGIGRLDSHAASAQAAMDTSLSCVPRPTIDSVLDTRAAEPSAGDEESTRAETSLVRLDAFDPVQRLAALFVTLSRYNAYEGREPSIITDSLKCGAVAGHLDMSVDALAAQLAELEARGLIEPCDAGLRLLDIEELERLADSPDA